MTLKGENIVFTGALRITRDEASRLAERAGAHVSSSVTGNTTLVIVGEAPGSKLTKAGMLGIKTINEKEFFKILGSENEVLLTEAQLAGKEEITESQWKDFEESPIKVITEKSLLVLFRRYTFLNVSLTLKKDGVVVDNEGRIRGKWSINTKEEIKLGLDDTSELKPKPEPKKYKAFLNNKGKRYMASHYILRDELTNLLGNVFTEEVLVDSLDEIDEKVRPYVELQYRRIR